MQFDKLIFRGSNRSGRHIRVIVDFGIGEITAQSEPGGEVMWCRLTGHRGSVLRMKLDACDFGTREDSCTMQDRGGPTAGGIDGTSRLPSQPLGAAPRNKTGGSQKHEVPANGWSLDLCSGEQPVKHLSGNDEATEQCNAFASIVDLCLSFAENRSVGQRVPLSPEPTIQMIPPGAG